jgi:hypothetical protein
MPLAPTEVPDEPLAVPPLRVASGPPSGDPFAKPDVPLPEVPAVLAAPVLEPATAPGAPELSVDCEDEPQAARIATRVRRLEAFTSLDMGVQPSMSVAAALDLTPLGGPA